MYVWGATLDDGIHDYVRRGWLRLDSAFCAWWAGIGQHWDDGSVAPRTPPRSVRGSQGPDDGSAGVSSPSSKTEKEKEKKPNTGKEFVPGHDGSIKMREYAKRVKLHP